MRSPARGIWERVLVEIRVSTEPARHATQLGVLFPLDVQQVLLDRGRDGIAGCHGWIVDHPLRQGG